MALSDGSSEPLMKSSLETPSPTPGSGPETVAKSAIAEALRRRSERHRACYSLPASLGIYIIFCISYVWHADSTDAFTFESAVVSDLVYASGPGGGSFYDEVYSRDSWAAWLGQGLLPALGVGDGSDPSEASQIIGGYALPLGGVRVVQLRSATGSCADGVAGKLYPGSCYDSAQAGDAGAIGNATAAADFGTPASAFTPTTLPGDPSAAYQLLLSTVGPLDVEQSKVDGLTAGGWTDGATQTLRVQTALLNAQPGIDRWATVTYDLTFTRGGVARVAATVSSFPWYAYGRAFQGPDAGFVALLDVLMCFYAVYLAWGTVRRTITACTRSKGCGARISTSVGDPWRLIDYGATGALLSVIVTWARFAAQVQSLRDSVSKDEGASPAVYSDGSSRPGFIVSLLSLQTQFVSARLAGAWALIFLAIRQFKYLQYQPRLAVMSASLAMSITDGVAFSVLFMIVLSCYGVWGLGMFGSQAPDWQDPHVAVTSLFRYMMYDYDLPAMEATDVDMARLFFASYMLLVTNMTLWMFLAIFLESYTVVRQASHLGSGMVEDAVEAGYAFLEMAATCPPWRKGGCMSRTRHNVASCNALIAVLAKGSLAVHERITIAQLQSAARQTATGATLGGSSSEDGSSGSGSGSGSGGGLKRKESFVGTVITLASPRHALNADQVRSVWEEARSIEAAIAEGGFAASIPTLTGLSAEEEDHSSSSSSYNDAASPDGKPRSNFGRGSTFGRSGGTGGGGDGYSDLPSMSNGFSTGGSSTEGASASASSTRGLGRMLEAMVLRRAATTDNVGLGSSMGYQSPRLPSLESSLTGSTAVGTRTVTGTPGGVAMVPLGVGLTGSGSGSSSGAAPKSSTPLKGSGPGGYGSTGM